MLNNKYNNWNDVEMSRKLYSSFFFKLGIRILNSTEQVKILMFQKYYYLRNTVNALYVLLLSC